MGTRQWCYAELWTILCYDLAWYETAKRSWFLLFAFDSIKKTFETENILKKKKAHFLALWIAIQERKWILGRKRNKSLILCCPRETVFDLPFYSKLMRHNFHRLCEEVYLMPWIGIKIISSHFFILTRKSLDFPCLCLNRSTKMQGCLGGSVT